MRNKLSILLSVLSISCSVAVLFYTNRKIEKIVVIDAIKVVNEFKMKKDLEGRVDGKLRGYSEQIDSVKGIINNALQRHDTISAMSVSNYLQSLQQQASQAYQVSNQAINEQVWKRLNPMIDEYGKDKGFRVIIGANGMGSVLYKDDCIDKTEELLKYINTKYEKGE